jgi:hypothetical protein
MPGWKYIIRFEADDAKIYYSQLNEPVIPTSTLRGHSTIEAAQAADSGSMVSIRKVALSIQYRRMQAHH